MDDCCNRKGDEIAALAQGGRRRVLQMVLVINLVMFVTEFSAGVVAQSTSLMADSLDMLGDALVYIVSLYALARSHRWKAGAALMKAGLILLFAAWIVVEVIQTIRSGTVPVSSLMGIFGAIALGANLTCLMLLWRHRHEDVNMSSTFECSRNDVITNVGVLIAAAGVWFTGRPWPDIVVGSLVALLLVYSAIKVIRDALPVLRHPGNVTRPVHLD